MRVAVHFNLDSLRRGDPELRWSIKATSKSGGSVGKLMGHTKACALVGVTFHVAGGKHGEIIRRGKRTVCAWMTGELVEAEAPKAGAEVAAYNPFRSADFTAPDGRTITKADRVDFDFDGRAYCQNAS